MRMNRVGKGVRFDICSSLSLVVLKILRKSSSMFTSSSLIAAFIFPWNLFIKKLKRTCEKVHKNLLHQREKSRYQNASMTVEASVAFPVFFFAVLYLLQMFLVLRAELMIAEAGITAVREIATYSYAAERLAEGENAVSDKLLEIFDQKLVKDASLTAVFYAGCDNKVLEEGRVAQGLGGIWVSTEEEGDKVQAKILYKVKPLNVWESEKGRYYTLHLVYRPWTGEGELGGEGGLAEEAGTVVYMTRYGTVYHRDRNCTYIKINTSPISVFSVENERNEGGARYYPCELCRPERIETVYITSYGTRYHEYSSCSAIRREVQEVLLEKVKENYRACSKCGEKEAE